MLSAKFSINVANVQISFETSCEASLASTIKNDQKLSNTLCHLRY